MTGRAKSYRGGNPGGYPCADNAKAFIERYRRVRQPIMSKQRWTGAELQAYQRWRNEWIDQCLQCLPPWSTLITPPVRKANLYDPPPPVS